MSKAAAATGLDQTIQATINLQTITRFRIPLDRLNTRSDTFGTLAHFEANKAKYIEAIAKAYNHPASLIDIELKPNTLDEIIVTFRIQEEAAKTNLLNTMQDEDALKTKLDDELEAVGAQVEDGDAGFSNSAVTDVPGRDSYIIIQIHI